jgi:hypothetical protein
MAAANLCFMSQTNRQEPLQLSPSWLVRSGLIDALFSGRRRGLQSFGVPRTFKPRHVNQPLLHASNKQAGIFAIISILVGMAREPIEWLND